MSAYGAASRVAEYAYARLLGAGHAVHMEVLEGVLTEVDASMATGMAHQPVFAEPCLYLPHYRRRSPYVAGEPRVLKGVLVTSIMCTNEMNCFRMLQMPALTLPTQARYFLIPQHIDMMFVIDGHSWLAQHLELFERTLELGAPRAVTMARDGVRRTLPSEDAARQRLLREAHASEGGVLFEYEYRVSVAAFDERIGVPYHDGNRTRPVVERDDDILGRSMTVFVKLFNMSVPMHTEVTLPLLREQLVSRRSQVDNETDTFWSRILLIGGRCFSGEFHYGYVNGNRFYCNQLWQMPDIYDYDFVFKIDVDVHFTAELPFLIMEDMDRRDALFAHGARYFDGDAACVDNFAETVLDYYRTARTNTCSPHAPESMRGFDEYYGNFIVMRNDFFRSAPVQAFSHFVSDVPAGWFLHRWGDQLYWATALSAFAGPDFREHVIDYSEFRCCGKQCYVPGMAEQCAEEGRVFVHQRTEYWRPPVLAKRLRAARRTLQTKWRTPDRKPRAVTSADDPARTQVYPLSPRVKVSMRKC